MSFYLFLLLRSALFLLCLLFLTYFIFLAVVLVVVSRRDVGVEGVEGGGVVLVAVGEGVEGGGAGRFERRLLRRSGEEV